ncbi:DeoR/GlpR transcriptional regulator [Spiroplasma chinense]|uniref:DeoR/GlpR transcriptional regulator n=1 Tax=Spiroplasma chinense TaxID=216932 RepID=A0A5B9Y7H9_9MOLU|nr:DeoR/GlpR family DNA-binding transcription regulator [Spiroplasma chinense]QEH62277.1 DeoR/GlpR transcriptional regulator [Spiroplasma chinense]
MNKERLNNTWNFLKTKNSHTSKTLLKYAKQNNINEMTFRRDLHLLEKNGFVKLHYGYLEVLTPELELTENIKVIKLVNLNLKEQIALEAVKLLENNDSIFVGPGSTCEVFVTQINVRVQLLVTNGINVLSKASKNNFVNTLIMVGGKLIHNTSIIAGSSAINQLDDFAFKKAFITAQHIDEDGNVYVDNHSELNFIKKVVSVSEKKYLLVDSTKYNSKGLIKICNLMQFDKVITK